MLDSVRSHLKKKKKKVGREATAYTCGFCRETLKKSDIWSRAEVTMPCSRTETNRDRFI